MEGNEIDGGSHQIQNSCDIIFKNEKNDCLHYKKEYKNQTKEPHLHRDLLRLIFIIHVSQDVIDKTFHIAKNYNTPVKQKQQKINKF